MRKPRNSAFTPLHETAEQWLERLGYCLHVPTCSDSSACRQKRALEQAQQPPKPRVFTGQTAQSRKLDYD